MSLLVAVGLHFLVSGTPAPPKCPNIQCSTFLCMALAQPSKEMTTQVPILCSQKAFPSLLLFKPQEKTYEGKMFRQRNVTVVLPKFSVLKPAPPRLKIYVLTHRLSISQSSWHLYPQPQFWLVSKGVIVRLFGLGLH